MGEQPAVDVVASLPLSAAFERAQALASHSGSTHKTSELLELLDHAQSCVEAAALFSSNEDAEDLATAAMRYLLLPFMKAEALHTRAPAREPAARHAQLAAALACYSAFLQRAAQYGLLGPAGHQAFAAEEAGARPDPGTARAAKIERFKRSRALEGLLQQLGRRRRDTDEEAGTEGGPPGGVGGWDEEDERRLWALQLEGAAIRSLDARPLVAQELALLEHAAAAQQQQQGQSLQPQSLQQQRSGSSRDSSASGEPQQRQQQQRMMMDRLAGIAGQLSVTDTLQAMRQQVFRPSHILPTLTVEQQGAIELRQAQECQAASDAAAAAATAAAAGRRSDDEDDDEVAASRAWDDWKDDNPRGWGNSKLRPCA